jgi:hypothetical protein
VVDPSEDESDTETGRLFVKRIESTQLKKAFKQQLSHKTPIKSLFPPMASNTKRFRVWRARSAFSANPDQMMLPPSSHRPARAIDRFPLDPLESEVSPSDIADWADRLRDPDSTKQTEALNFFLNHEQCLTEDIVKSILENPDRQSFELVDAVTHVFCAFSKSRSLVRRCTFAVPIVEYLVEVLDAPFDEDPEVWVTCFQTLAGFCRDCPGIGAALCECQFRESAERQLRRSIKRLMKVDDRNSDIWAESLHLATSILDLFTWLIDCDEDHTLGTYVVGCFVPLFKHEDEFLERLVCRRLAPIAFKVADESIRGVMGDLAEFLDRLLEAPDMWVASLAAAIAGRESDEYGQFLVDLGIMRLYMDTEGMLGDIQEPAALLLRNLASSHMKGPIAFMFEEPVVEFMDAVFESGRFKPRQDCLMAVMLLLQKGLVEPVLLAFRPAFVCLPDALEVADWKFCDTALRAFAVLLGAFARAPPEWMAEERVLIASQRMIDAFGEIAARTPAGQRILDALEEFAC